MHLTCSLTTILYHHHHSSGHRAVITPGSSQVLVISKESRQGTTASPESKGKALKSFLFMAVMNEDSESPWAGLLNFFLTFC